MPKLLLILIAVLVIFADQISKTLVVIFNLPYILNSGAAFGIFDGNIFFLVLVSICLISFLLFKFKFSNFQDIIGLALILGGGVSNLFNRIHSGYVLDFIDFKIWPAFNLADTAIVMGVLVILSQFVFPRKVS
jgi:signal peptidase II